MRRILSAAEYETLLLTLSEEEWAAVKKVPDFTFIIVECNYVP